MAMWHVGTKGSLFTAQFTMYMHCIGISCASYMYVIMVAEIIFIFIYLFIWGGIPTTTLDYMHVYVYTQYRARAVCAVSTKQGIFICKKR